MFALCWFYCIPFANFAWYATAPLLMMVALFVMKRGILLQRKNLRILSFFMILLSGAKILVLDWDPFVDAVLCSRALELNDCAPLVRHIAYGMGWMLLAVFCWYMWEFWQKFVPHADPRVRQTPEQAQIVFWSRAAMGSVVFMALWQLIPWLVYLGVGEMPAVFRMLPWQPVAMVSFAIIVIAFWRFEDCYWYYNRKYGGAETSHKAQGRIWLPRDTLWMTVSLYVVTLGLSYVAHDILN